MLSVGFDPLKIGSALEGPDSKLGQLLEGFDPLKIGSALEAIDRETRDAAWQVLTP